MSSVFDAHAAGYDAVAESDLGRRLRLRVHEVVDAHLEPSMRVIDLGCGTGLDLEWLSKRVVDVHGVEPAAAMADRARARVDGRPNVRVTTGRLDDLDVDIRADLLLANFGAVNCLGPLDAVGRELARRVEPGGLAVCVTMPATCPIELAVAVATRNRELLHRRRSAESEADYVGLDVRYATAHDLAETFVGFELVHAEALGVVLPPFEQRSWVQGRPRVLDLADRADRTVAGLAARRGWGDHHIAVLRRVP